jgi:DNA topoisomerase-1
MTSNQLKISEKKLERLLDDPKETAQAIQLVYMLDSKPGITRKKRRSKFCYFLDGKEIFNEVILSRINKLAIPPAWKNVWICPEDNGHLQATGFDSKQRKQYRYHPLWNSFRNHTKFYRLYEFGKAIPRIRKQVQKDLGKPGLPPEKVLATIIYLMECTSIRIGNTAYEKRYGSYGLSTLKDKHVNINQDKIVFSFIGKKGIHHSIGLKNKKLASIVKQCRDIPGKELFQYDQQGNPKAIDSGMVNDYLKSISGQDFTTKDFRTWIGTKQAICAFKQTAIAKTKNQIQKNIIETLDKVSAHLGNTRAVCKKYYVHPLILELYQCNQLGKFFNETCRTNRAINQLALEEGRENLAAYPQAQKSIRLFHR